MQQFVKKYLEAYNNFLNKYYIYVISATIITTIISLFFATKLGLKTDFKEMLPTEKYRSVTDLNKILDRVGGIGNLVVAVESDNFEANKKFVQDLVKELDNMPKNYIRYVEYNIEEIKNFYLENKYLYIDLEDLKEIKERLNAKIAYEENKRNPFYVALEDEKAVSFDINDIEQKYKNKTGEYSKYKDNFFTGENGKLFAVVIKPYGTATQVGFSKKLINEVNKIIEKLDPQKYDRSMKIGLTGKAKTVVTEYQSLKEDLVGTAILCIILVALVIYFYYFRFKVIILSAITVIIGIIWTFAFTYFKIGYLNTQTAFLGAIIIGNGVNYGLILLARYLEEEKINHNIKNSLYTALSTTIVGTFASSFTTSAGFGTLLLTDVKGYSQFGFIGAIGMFSCWIASYTVLPTL
jgi:predicted RND superfamily exporter protein